MKPLIDPVNTGDGLFHTGDKATGTKGTRVTADYMNNNQAAVRITQQELLSVLAAAGIKPDESKTDQLLTAIHAIAVPKTGGSVAYLEDATHYSTKPGDGTGSLLPERHFEPAAPFLIPEGYEELFGDRNMLRAFLKGYARKKGGKPVAISFGALTDKDHEHASPAIHVIDSDKKGNMWVFRTEDGSLCSPGALYAGNAFMDIDGNIKSGSIWGNKSLKDYIDSAVGSIKLPEGLPAGIPHPWPTDTAPAGFMLMAGQEFNKQQYPQLAAAYPTGRVPDMRGQTIKGRPDGRDVLSAEDDGVKSHSHGGRADDTDLGSPGTSSHDYGTPQTSAFDYGSKQSNTFDYGNKGTNAAGWHDHAGGMCGPGAAWANMTTGTDNDGSYPKNRTDGNGNHAHSVWIGAHDHWTGIGAHNHTLYIGAHSHSVSLGAHGHSLSITATGNAENTVKNIAFNYIVRLA
ncbi:phage tail protein [Serratia bockelmannii]|uniref:phage tail protein n=1 Tax=Serratia bockelmannii TaxID=2703793 RepID=UPI003FA73443